MRNMPKRRCAEFSRQVFRLAAFVPDTSSWLVATKLQPPLVRTDTIRRPRLEETLCRSVAQLPVTLLSAPAGYGKTTMLACLPHLLPEFPMAWVTLDADDNDPIGFLGLLISAVQKLHPACGQAVWPLLGGANAGAGLKRAVGAFINDITKHLPDPFILVLDDLHFVTAPAVYVALEYLLDHQPAQMHIAIGTRYDPPLRLAKLAARRQIAELRRMDLEFSQSEAEQLLNQTLGLRLTAQEVATLQERTEGWPAGLCLLAGPLGRLSEAVDRTQFMTAVANTERYALDFLAEEVLRNLPDELRLFLMQTSILAEMTPAVCEAVTGRSDAADILEQLYRQNLTIASLTTQVDGEPVYRHHALFARLLVQQLERELPDAIAELHCRAAAAQQTPGRAIHHLIAAGLWEEAAQLMLQAGMQLLHRGMAETVRNWYKALPEQVRIVHPRLAVIMGRCEIHRGDYNAANMWLNQAREACMVNGDAEGEGEALTSLITLTMQNDDPQAAAALVERALQLPLTPMGQVAARLTRAWLGLHDCDWASMHTDIRDALVIPRATGNRQADLIGITYLSAPMAAMPGCLELVEQYCAEASAQALPATAWRLGADELRAWLLLWRGELAEALKVATDAENLRQSMGGYPFVGNDAAALLSVLHIAGGDTVAAETATEAMLQRLDTAPRFKGMFFLHAAGRALTLLKRYDAAHDLLVRLKSLRRDSLLNCYLQTHLEGLLALATGRMNEAETALQQSAALELQLPIAWVGGSARLLQARLRWEQGDESGALAGLLPVLRAWEQAGTPGCAVLDGRMGLPVYQLAAKRGNAAATKLTTLFAGAAGSTQPMVNAQDTAAADLPEPLTQRECEVLRLIVAGHTNREIADTLYISTETVKTHVARILHKLAVSSRTQAAIRGRSLGF